MAGRGRAARRRRRRHAQRREGSQVLGGDAGVDTADYTNHSSDAVDVSLDGVANDGIRDFEFDNVLPSTENVRGSNSGGVLVGSAAANRLEGGAGKDDIDGGAGADTLLGSAGDDVLLSADRERDAEVDCGAGLDLAIADHQDPIKKAKHPRANCESVSYVEPHAQTAMSPTLSLRDGSSRVFLGFALLLGRPR